VTLFACDLYQPALIVSSGAFLWWCPWYPAPCLWASLLFRYSGQSRAEKTWFHFFYCMVYHIVRSLKAPVRFKIENVII